MARNTLRTLVYEYAYIIIQYMYTLQQNFPDLSQFLLSFPFSNSIYESIELHQFNIPRGPCRTITSIFLHNIATISRCIIVYIYAAAARSVGNCRVIKKQTNRRTNPSRRKRVIQRTFPRVLRGNCRCLIQTLVVNGIVCLH